MQLSVLDQSPIRQNGTAQQAFAETLELARFTESLGFHRFWVSEHHSTDALAGSAPEVLLAAIGQHTSTMRIGSGGIMLPHYSPYKVAEAASTLACLFPDRVDVGVGRAPGTDMVSARALSIDGKVRFDQFPEQVENLLTMLNDESYRPAVNPKPQQAPPVWMLGSSPDSAILAAEKGLPYNFALFINPDMDPRILDYYRQRFQPSGHLEKPYTSLTVNVVCADTEEEAKLLARSRAISFLRFATGKGDSRLCSPEEAASVQLSADEESFLAQRAKHAAVGTPEQVRDKLFELADSFGADELMTVTITYDFEARKKSYQLLADAFQLKTQ
jgi:luciferase family oxidoreductase group 1